VNEVTRYLSNSSVNAPFFLVVGDSNYASIKAKLLEIGLKPVTVSNCCSAPDKPPNLDKLFSSVDFADIDGGSRDKKVVILGLGEYLALKGEKEAFKRLSDIKDHKVGSARVVLLLRGVSALVRKLQSDDDQRFDGRRVFLSDNTDSGISIAIVPPALNLTAKNGVKELLAELENGKTTVSVKTNMTFDNALFSICKINSAYDGVKHIRPTFPLAESLGTPEQWKEFLDALTASNGEISKVIEEFGKNPETELTNWLGGATYKHWLYFITLKLSSDGITNSYLKYVITTSDKLADLKKNILTAIISVPRTDERFNKFYRERKEIIGRLIVDKKLSDSDFTELFIYENRRDLVNGLYTLTDRTLPERKEFISMLANLGTDAVVSRAAFAYSALPDYLHKYSFTDPKVTAELNALFTDYFDRYKKQKVANVIDGDFVAEIEYLAKKRVYNKLRTRSEVLASVGDKSGTFLLWIDALGVEYLAFIQKLCEQKGLSLRIHIAQADLPTITSVNNAFYADCDFKGKEKIDLLDKLKHKASGGYNYETERLPIHLAQELDVIADAIEKAKSKLVSDKPFKKVLIVSDHGASRLAVINEQEEKYDTDTKGEHGGRCCKRPPDFSPTAYDLPFATESADGQFVVLANYGRFKGSRKANVEVHGGASLEEVVIPIIEVTLANPNTKIELIDGDKLYASFRKPLVFTLFSKTELQNVSAVIKDKPEPFNAEKLDKNHYQVTTNIKRPGKYYADVFDGDSLVGVVTLIVQSETQKKNGGDDFNSLF
jgi:hypothetical protein